jgi:spore germination protein YaaH
LCALSAAFVVTSAPSAHAQRLEALWYSTANPKSTQSFIDHADQISIVAPQVFAFDKNGRIHGKLDPRLVEVAHEKSVKLVPLVMNPGFDQALIHRILTVDDARRRAVQSLVALCRDQHLDGIQFDIENVNVKDRDALTRFVRESSAALHAIDCPLSAAVVPRESDVPGPTSFHRWIYDNWRGAYDYKALADTLAFISYMTYAQHTGGTTPGPVAGYRWMQANLDYALRLGIPPAKISLGIPSYSDHWYSGYDKKTGEHARGRDIGYATAESLLTHAGVTATWFDPDKASYAFWSNDGAYEHLWIEDARAFAAKLGIVRAHQLRGYSVWVLGLEDPAVWSIPALRERTLAP